MSPQKGGTIKASGLENGRWTFPQSASFGLAGGSPIFNMVLVTEELLKACGGIALCFAGSALGALPIVVAADEEQKRRFLPDIAAGRRLAALALREPKAGSDAAAISTTARRDGDYYILNGTKQWITNGGEAEIIERRIYGLTRLIGNTPLLALDFTFRDQPRVLYAKAENLNMTGSIKDRMALHIIRQAYAKGILKPDGRIVEATSGNTGISFSGIGRALGHPVTIFMPDWMSQERINLIHSLGATNHRVSRDEGGFLECIRRAEELASTGSGFFLPHQFSNEDNVAAHEQTTGPEIWWQLRFHSLKPDAFVAGVGTGGTVMGVGRYLRTQKPDVKIYPLEPANLPTLSTGHKVGKHRVQGISDEFIPPIVDLDFLDDVISIDDGDAILMAQKLVFDLGIGVGISSGANFLGSLYVQNQMGEKAVVATVFPDDNKKYLSTDLLREEPVKEGFLSPDVQLIGFRAFRRVCHTCCDPFECTQNTPLDLEEGEQAPPPCPLGGERDKILSSS